MADIVNMQVYGVPVITYGLVGLTTAVLAYVTSLEMGADITKTIEQSLPENPMSSLDALSNMNPLASGKESEPSSPKNTESLFSGLEERGEEGKEEEELKPSSSAERSTGGKKRRRQKTPKSKKINRKNRSRKMKKM